MDRHCARPGCARPASATMSYDYVARTAWLDELTPDPEPSGYDLCAAHADGLGVPKGWGCDDRRATGDPSLPSSLAS